MKKYVTPSIEVFATPCEDVITTSLYVDLPWMPMSDDSYSKTNLNVMGSSNNDLYETK